MNTQLTTPLPLTVEERRESTEFCPCISSIPLELTILSTVRVSTPLTHETKEVHVQVGAFFETFVGNCSQPDYSRAFDNQAQTGLTVISTPLLIKRPYGEQCPIFLARDLQGNSVHYPNFQEVGHFFPIDACSVYRQLEILWYSYLRRVLVVECGMQWEAEQSPGLEGQLPRFI